MTERKKELQNNFYKWLMHRRLDSMSFRTIKQSAIEFLKAFVDEGLLSEHETPLDLLFYPLLRSGVVMYIGMDNYRLSPTCSIILNDKTLLVNYPETIRQSLVVSPGLQLTDEHINRNYPEIIFNLDDVLKQIPSFEAVIKNSPDFKASKSSINREWLIRRSREWIGQEGVGPLNYFELYKNSDNYGSPLHLKAGQTVYHLPTRERNPQAFPLASILTQLGNNNKTWSPVELSNTGVLRINLKIFPHQFEKCLLLESLSLGVLPEKFRNVRQYQVGTSHIPKLLQLFLLD